MHNQTNWNIAVTRFAAFCSGLPLSPDEYDVSQYHDIIKLFEDACGQDLSKFKIASDRIRPATYSTAMASGWGGKQAQYHGRNSVDFRYFRGQVRGLIDYMMSVLKRRPC
jgi:hypothetical protein